MRPGKGSRQRTVSVPCALRSVSLSRYAVSWRLALLWLACFGTNSMFIVVLARASSKTRFQLQILTLILSNGTPNLSEKSFLVSVEGFGCAWKCLSRMSCWSLDSLGLDS